MNAVQTWHIMNDFSQLPATLWPGGENADDEKAVKPISYALTVCPTDAEADREPDTAEIRMVSLILQDDPFIVVAEITGNGGWIKADSSTGGHPETEMEKETATAIFRHYASRFNGKTITLSVHQDADQETEQDDRYETPVSKTTTRTP